MHEESAEFGIQAGASFLHHLRLLEGVCTECAVTALILYVISRDVVSNGGTDEEIEEFMTALKEAVIMEITELRKRAGQVEPASFSDKRKLI